MKILVSYATNSGGTQAASQIAVDALTAAGHTLTYKMARESVPADFESHDFVLLASPSWDFGSEEGMPHEDFLELFKQFDGKKFEGKKFAVLGLGDSSYTKFCGCVDHLEEFVKKLGGSLVHTSLKVDGFFYHPENNETVKAWAEELAKKLA